MIAAARPGIRRNASVAALTGSVTVNSIGLSGFGGNSIYNQFTVSAATSVNQLRFTLQGTGIGSGAFDCTIGLTLASGVGATPSAASFLTSAHLSVPSPISGHEYTVAVTPVVLSSGVTYALVCLSLAASHGPNGADAAMYGTAAGSHSGVINTLGDGHIHYSQNDASWTDFGVGSFQFGIN
jgi:hypothetical protein